VRTCVHVCVCVCVCTYELMRGCEQRVGVNMIWWIKYVCEGSCTVTKTTFKQNSVNIHTSHHEHLNERNEHITHISSYVHTHTHTHTCTHVRTYHTTIRTPSQQTKNNKYEQKKNKKQKNKIHKLYKNTTSRKDRSWEIVHVYVYMYVCVCIVCVFACSGRNRMSLTSGQVRSGQRVLLITVPGMAYELGFDEADFDDVVADQFVGECVAGSFALAQ